ncbi:hypothetical protein JOQ06_018333 [Pogonophryne albipinna]|uniref:Adenosine 3'-phospho 5'-phosphosulfate transporter 2 n=1 Tax=Pogonophryne albipinna TaxID=1090488 RepID=A0AAD6AIV8_9TELE|nr:hypothetical protein JOQ06_018333 [Pogonophryne albipinna]
MSAKYGLVSYNSSRKHISISIPSSTEVMSPHIKSVEELRVLGINLSIYSSPTQFMICVAGVFLFYLIYGYLQELIFSVEGIQAFRMVPHSDPVWILLHVGSGGASANAGQTQKDTRERPYMMIAVLTVMIGGVFIQGKRYNVADVSAALCMSLGLIWFTLADSKVAPNFNVTGVLLISLALCADAAIGNVQEKAMKLHNGSNSEMACSVWGSGASSGFLLRAPCEDLLVTRSCSLLRVTLASPSFSALIKLFGALVAVTVTTGRKAMTVVLSFMFFAKPFTFQYIWAGLLVLFGIFLNVYSKNSDKMKLPSIKDLKSWVLTGKKVRLLSQNV